MDGFVGWFYTVGPKVPVADVLTLMLLRTDTERYSASASSPAVRQTMVVVCAMLMTELMS